MITTQSNVIVLQHQNMLCRNLHHTQVTGWDNTAQGIFSKSQNVDTNLTLVESFNTSHYKLETGGKSSHGRALDSQY